MDKFKKINKKIKTLYQTATIKQIEEINDIRGEYTVAAKMLIKEYMDKELAIYKKLTI